MHTHACARVHTCASLLLAWSLQLKNKYASTRKLGEACEVAECCRGWGHQETVICCHHTAAAWSGHPWSSLLLGKPCVLRVVAAARLSHHCHPGGPAVRTGMAHLPVSVFPALSKKPPVGNQLPRSSHERDSEGSGEDGRVQILLLSSTLLTSLWSLEQIAFP